MSASSISMRCVARERAVVRADERLAGELVERGRQPLGEPPAVDEDQRRAMRADQLEQPRVDRRPDRAAALGRRPARSEISSGGNLDALRPSRRHVLDAARSTRSGPKAFLPRPGVDDRRPGRGVGRRRAGRRRPAPPRKRRDLVERPLRRRESRCAARRGSRPSVRTLPRAARATARGARRAWSATSAWISSTMTVSTDRSASRAFDVSSR